RRRHPRLLRLRDAHQGRRRARHNQHPGSIHDEARHRGTHVQHRVRGALRHRPRRHAQPHGRDVARGVPRMAPAGAGRHEGGRLMATTHAPGPVAYAAGHGNGHHHPAHPVSYWWKRAAWWTVGGVVFGLVLVVFLRAVFGLDPLWEEQVYVTSTAIFGVLGFLVGIGVFDWWGRWMIGRKVDYEDHSMHGAASWRDYLRVNTDHKVIGIQYLVTVVFFLFVGGALAEMVRGELAQPGDNLVSPATYNSLFSAHAAIMIFLVVIPSFAGLANFVLPIMIGAKDMAFPRLNALSVWMLPPAGFMILTGMLLGGYGAGWTVYAPLAIQGGTGTTLFEIGVQFAGASSIMTAVNFLVTIITMRAPGMTVWRMPLLVWANATTSALVVFGTPFIAGSQFMSLFDRVMGTHFFDWLHGGDVIS